MASVVLLLFNLIGAFYGGINLILHPDGSSIALSLALLKYTPFNDYLIPGVILLSTNGIFCTFVLLKVLQSSKNYGRLVLVQGMLLSGWIIVQILLIRTIFFLHFILGGIGICLIALGWMQHTFQKNIHIKLQDK
ncbi:MAG: hypothetical protein IPL65_05270 [Lewinellaceae bacterium]|nr:hypothetical protein [Lewinellaceae bacterium]